MNDCIARYLISVSKSGSAHLHNNLCLNILYSFVFHRIQEFDDLLRLSGKSTVATVALHSNETLRNNFKQKSYDMLGNNDLARLEVRFFVCFLGLC